MESVHLVDMQFEAGDRITKTVDIRTDSGYVLLIHEDPEVITKDYARICELQKTMFVIEESDENLVEEKEQDFKLDEIEETEDEATDSDSEEGSREVVEEDSTGHNSSSDETKGVDHTENAVESELVLKSDYNSENLDTDIINVDVEKKSPVPSDESFPKLEDELIAPVESSPIEIQEDQKDAVTESATSAAYRTSSYDSGEVDTNPSIKTSRRKSRRLQHLTKASSVRHLDELSPAEQWKRQVLDAAQKSYYPKEVGSYQPLKNFNFKQMVMSYLRRFIILGLGAYIASIFTTLTLPRFKSAIIS